MLVRKITMLWEPGTGAPSKIDYMIAEGSLTKDGLTVTTLPNTGVHMVDMDSLVMWELSAPVEADSVVLRLYDVDYPHTVDIDGAQFSIPALDVAWGEYNFKLTPTPELPTPSKIESWFPMSPIQGPPLPRFLGLLWPWYKIKGD